MDFLEIRRKAKERAAARAAASARQGEADPAGPAPTTPSAPPAAPPAPPRAASTGHVSDRQSPTPTAEESTPPAERPPLALEPLPLPGGAPEEDRFAEFHPSRAPAPPDPATLEVAEAAARIEAELAARLGELPAAPDARFRTWRPAGAVVPDVAPVVPEPPEPAGRPAPGPAPAPEAAGPADPLDEFFYRPDEVAAALGSLAATPSPAAVEVPASLEEYLTFLLGEEEYGVAIGRVREVMRSPPITEVPRAPADVLGVITVRGEVVAVFEPRLRLGLPPGGDRSGGRVVIVDDGGGACGLLVDSVASVVRVAAGSVEPCPQGMGGASADCLAGIGRDHDRLFTVLDVAALLRPARRTLEGRG